MTDDARLFAGMRFLLVEDDVDLRDFLDALLRDRGARVYTAGSGTDALDMLARHGPFDLVITDVQMPPPGGLHLATAARTAGASVPFLVITAFSTERVRPTLDRVERTELLDKPFSPERFIALAHQLAAAHPGRRRPRP